MTWKKTGKGRYENELEDEWEIRVENKNVFILEPNESLTKMSKWKKRSFKTKPQAIKFAKDYMRKRK